MEHRWGHRVPTNIEVQIFADPASAAWGQLRDISASGGYLETGLRIPTLSTLCITVPAIGMEEPRVVRAIVVRADEQGVGVEWFDGDSEVINALVQDATAERSQIHLSSRRQALLY